MLSEQNKKNKVIVFQKTGNMLRLILSINSSNQIININSLHRFLIVPLTKLLKDIKKNVEFTRNCVSILIVDL